MGNIEKVVNNTSFKTEELIECLKDVIDPEMMVNIVDLGMVYKLEVLEDQILVDFTLTTPFCDITEDIRFGIEYMLKSKTNLPVAATCVWQPPWDESRLSEEARLVFGYDI